MGEIFILESWVVQLLNRIAEASARGEDFNFHMDKEMVKKSRRLTLKQFTLKCIRR